LTVTELRRGIINAAYLNEQCRPADPAGIIRVVDL